MSASEALATPTPSPDSSTALPAGAFHVSVLPSLREFDVNPGEAMLAAGIRQGIGLPYGCKDGACGSCKCKKISGVVKHGPHQAKALSDQEEANGFVLTCCGFPQSDVVLESRQVALAGAFPIRKMPSVNRRSLPDLNRNGQSNQ